MSKAYLITHEADYANAKLQVFDTKTAAGEASFKSNAHGKLMVASADDLAALSGPELAGLYNSLNGDSISKFRDLVTGRERLFASIKGLAESNDPAITKDIKAEKTTKEAKPKSDKKYDKVDLTKKISILKETNPRRASTKGHSSYALMKNGMTVEAYLKAGGRRVDLKWDLEKGNIKLID